MEERISQKKGHRRGEKAYKGFGLKVENVIN